jgi:hypothetical protein
MLQRSVFMAPFIAACPPSVKSRPQFHERIDFSHFRFAKTDVEYVSSFRRILQREGAPQKKKRPLRAEETTMADQAASNKPIKLEDQYKPLGLKAVLAAAMMCANDPKKKDAKPAEKVA